MYIHIFLLEKVLNPPQLSRARHTVRALAFLMNKRTHLNSLFVVLRMGVKEDLGRGGPWSVVQNIPAFFAQIFLLVYAFHFLLSLILFLPFRLLPWEAFPNTPQGGSGTPCVPTAPLPPCLLYTSRDHCG